MVSPDVIRTMEKCAHTHTRRHNIKWWRWEKGRRGCRRWQDEFFRADRFFASSIPAALVWSSATNWNDWNKTASLGFGWTLRQKGEGHQRCCWIGLMSMWPRSTLERNRTCESQLVEVCGRSLCRCVAFMRIIGQLHGGISFLLAFRLATENNRTGSVTARSSKTAWV